MPLGLRAPLLVPAVQPIELFFFQRVFRQLCQKRERRQRGIEPTGELEWAEDVDVEALELPLVDFQRAMVRLFRVIRDDRKFDIASYDFNRNGSVGWYEFCSLWRERGVYVRLTLAERAFLTLEDADRSLLGRVWSVLIFSAILISTGSFVVGTLPEYQTSCPGLNQAGFDPICKPQMKEIFEIIDLLCIILFTVEYVMRFVLSAFMRIELADSGKDLLLSWMVGDDAIPVQTMAGRVAHWVIHWANLIDLAAILPWYLSLAFNSTSGGSQSVVLKMIRLSRVLRAFRLGRRFQAVVIIMRSVRRSIRALYVLVLNLCLGMIFFGALMYFAEQGSWDPTTRSHLRWEDSTTESKSPFESIPACFWWAIVTATTVGYGDAHTPTTLPGRLVAGFSMIWSLCVLALPIGVIGGNFSQVWEEYDKVKLEDKKNADREQLVLQRSIRWGDPLYQCRMITLEVWHDSGLSRDPADGSQSEFLGEVSYSMDLSPDVPVKKQRLRMPLVQNYEKARRKVRGSLTFEYSWQPSMTDRHPDILLQGCLEVTVVGADNIVHVDWNGSAMTDPYCVIITYPNSPSKDGQYECVAHRTVTLYDTITPLWEFSASSEFCWTRSASRRGLVADMRRSVSEVSFSSKKESKASLSRRTSRSQNFDLSGSTAVAQQSQDVSIMSALNSDCDQDDCSRQGRTWTWDDEAGALLGSLPSLQADVRELSAELPQLHAEVAGVRRELQLALAALEKQSAPLCSGNAG